MDWGVGVAVAAGGLTECHSPAKMSSSRLNCCKTTPKLVHSFLARVSGAQAGYGEMERAGDEDDQRGRCLTV